MRKSVYFTIFLRFFSVIWLFLVNTQNLFAQVTQTIPNSPVDFPPAFECVFVPDFVNNFTIREAARTGAETIDLVMPLVGDVTGDGYPEILIPAKQENIGGDNDGYGRPYITSRTKDILVYQMATDASGNEVLNQIGRIITPYYSIEAPSQFVLAKVDGQLPLIIVAASWDPDNGSDASKLVAFRYNGAGFDRAWTSNESYGRNVPWSSKELVIEALNPGILQRYKFSSGAAPAVADFNADGTPEVYVYNEIFNASTGEFIVDGGMLRNPSDTTRYMGQGISQISPGPTDQLYAGTTAVSVAADLNNSGNLELAAGNTVYYVDIAGKSMTPVFAPDINGQFMRDGFTSIADIDKDGQLDIVVTTARDGLMPNSRQLYVWTLPTGSGPIRANNGALRVIQDGTGASNDIAISLAFIGDVNGDKNPNIGFNTPQRLWMLSYNAASNSFVGTWNASGFIPTNDQSGHTYITMFDFDQNGRQDLVYRDETNLRIIDGITGANQSTFISYSATANEGAIVADVDLDGEAEIIVTDRERALGVDPLDRTAAMVVYKSLSKPWAPARKVWNQYAYFSFNVNQDLTIPFPQPNHGKTSGFYFPKFNAFGCLEAEELPFNNFLVQTTLYNESGCQTTGVNLMDAEIEILFSRYICPSPDQTIEFEVTITNASDAIGDATAAIPVDTPISFYVDGVFIGQYTLSDFGLASVMPGDQVTFTTTIQSSVADALVSSSQSLQAIINWDHVSQDVLYEECIYDNTADLPLISRPIYSVNSPSPLCYEDNAGLINSFLIIPTNTVTGSVEGTQLQWFLNDPNGTPLTNNGVYTIDPIDFSLSITGLDPGTYTFYLVDECTNLTTSTDIEVYPLPVATFSTADAVCFDANTGSILVENHLSGYVYYVDGILYDGSNFGTTRFDSESSLENFGFKAGEYTIRTVNENGTNCQTITDVLINQPTAISISSIQENNPECEPSNGSISWAISGGTPSTAFPFYTYELTNISAGTVNTNPTISDFGGGQVGISNLEGGQYSLKATDNQGCEITQTFTLLVQQDPEFGFPSDATICEGDDHIAQISIINPGVPVANPTYIWGTNTGGNFTPLTNGQSVAGGIIEISSDGLTATFKGLSPNIAGHEFAVRIENACDQPDSPFVIIVNPAPKVDISTTDITCFGGDDGVIQVTKSSAADASEVYEYTLTETGEINSTGTFSGLSFQTNPYTILVRNTATQCFEYVTAELLQPEKVEFENVVLTESTCGTDNGEISGSVRGGKGPFDVFLIVGGNNIDTLNTSDSFQFTGLAAGSYVIQAMDAAGCLSDIFDAVIANDDKAALEINLSDIETCEGETVEIISQINSQGLPRTVSWYKDEQKNQLISNGPDNDDPTVSYSLDGENLIITGLKSGSNVTYYVDVTGDDFCPIDPEPVSIVVTPPLEIDLVYDQEICFGEGVLVTANATGGNGQFEFSLDGGAFQTKNIFENVSAGEHNLVIRTNQGCSMSETFTVIGPSSPLEINDDPVVISSSCDLENGEISNIQVIGGYGNYTIEWRFNDPNSAPIASNVLSLTDLAPGTYYLSITDEGGCALSESFELSELPDPKIAITEEEVCIGEDVILIPVQTVSGAAPTGLTWYLDEEGTILINEGPDPNDSNINYSIGDSLELTVSGLPIGDYSFFLKIECTGELVEAKAKVNSLPAPEFEITDVLCFGETTGKFQVSAGSDPNFIYVVNGGSPLTQGQLESQSFPAGNYTIMISNSQTGCFSEQELEITQPEELIYTKGSFQNPTCGDSNGTLTFTVEGGVDPYSVEVNNKPINEFTFSENQGLFSLTNLSPGSYSIVIRDSNNCLIDLLNEFTLINNEGTELQLEPLVDFICEGNSAVLSPQITTASGNLPEIRWYSNSSLTQQISSNFDPNGSGVMYQIDAQSGALTVFNLPAGEHKYYIQLSGAEFCTISEEAIIEVSPSISAEAEITDVTCFGEANGKILLTNIQGGNPPLEFSINGGAWQDNPLFENLSPGNYSVSVRDKIGEFECEFILEDIIIEGPDGPISIGPDVIIQRASCGLSNGSISNIEISGGWGNYQIEWRKDSPTGAILNSGNEQVISNLSPGKYFLIVTDSGNCSEVFDFEITEQNDPLYSPVAITDICEGENISLEAINTVSDAASSSFIWSKGPNKTNPISEGNDPEIPGVTYQFTEVNTTLGLDISGLPAGSYTYYLFIECTSQEIQFEFEVKASPSPTFQQNDISCFGAADGKIQVVSGGETDFEYSINGATPITQSDLDALNFGPGDYNIVVTNSIGCNSQTYNFQIQEPEELIIVDVQTKNSACGSGDGYIDIAWTGGTAAFVVSLLENGSVLSTSNTSDNDIRFDNLSPGDYDIVITDASNCQVSSTGVLSITDGPSEILADDLVICEGEIAVIDPEVNPSNSNATFSWYWNSISPSNLLSDGSTRGGVTISIDASGSIQLDGLAGGSAQVLFVTVAGEGICEGDQKRVEIKVDRAPEVSFTKKDEQCFGEGGEIQFTAADINQLEFSLNGGAFTKYPNGLIPGLSPGSYMVSVRNSSGCLTETANPIEVLGPSGTLEFVDFTISPSSCNSQDGQITSELRGGTAPYTIRLLNGSGTLLSSQNLNNPGNFTISGLAAGDYQVEVIDANQCILRGDAINLSDEPTAITIQDVTICQGEVAVLSASFSQSVSPISYEWYYDKDLTKRVSPNAAPDEYGATYSSSNPNSLSISSLPARSNPYSYFVMVTGPGVCPPQPKEVKVSVRQLPTLKVSNPSIVCDPNQSVDLTKFIEGYNPSVFDYVIISPTGAPLRLDQISAVKTNGSYTVQASFKGANCFTPIEKISVVIATTELVANFDYQIELPGNPPIVNSDVQALEEVKFMDNSQGDAIIWNWDFGDGTTSTQRNPTHQYQEAGQFLVKLTTVDSFGCISEVQRIIEVFDDYIIIIPNAFTPDGAKNQYFIPKHRGIASMEFYIFTTWGELIFETISLESKGWDGTFKGKPALNGNYVYRAKFVTRTGTKVDRSGVFVLIR